MSQRIIIGAVAAVLIIAAVAVFGFTRGGEVAAIAMLDRAIAPYDGEYTEATYDTGEDVLEVHGLTLVNFGEAGQDSRIDRVEMESLRLTGLAANNLHNDAEGPYTFFTLGEATGVRLTEGSEVVEIASMTVHNMGVDNIDHRMSEGLDAQRILAGDILATNIGELVIEGFSSPEGGATGMDVDRIVMTDLDDGGFASLQLDEVELWDDGQMGTVGDSIHMSIEQLAMTDVDAGRPLRRLFAGEPVNFDRQSDVPTFATLAIEGVVLSQEQGLDMRLARMNMRNNAYMGPLAIDTDVTVERLRVPLTQDLTTAEEASFFTDLGYHEVVMGLDYSSVFDPDDQTYDVPHLQLSLEDMGDVELVLGMTDIPLTADMFDRTSQELMADGFIDRVFSRAALSGASLSFVNTGLMERIYARNALEQGLSVEEFKAQAQADLETQRREMGSSPLASQAFDALSLFLEEPGTISVRATPDGPVPFSQMFIASQINPVLLVEMLNLEIEASD